MKKFTAISLAVILLLSVMAGCTRGSTEPTTQTTDPTQESTQPTTEPTQLTTQPTTDPAQLGTAETSSAKLLAKIWNEYGTDERFASYGGTVEHAVNDAPGDLDMTGTEEITNKYLLPVDQLSNVESGASLVHLMNNNIFTSVAFALKEGTDSRAVAKALRDNVQKTQWLCGQPDELLIAEVDGHLVMVFAAKEAMTTFRQNMKKAYANATVIYDEAVTA